MSAGIFDIVIEQGAKFFLPIEVFDANDQPYDLTGWTARGKVREEYDSPNALCSFTITGILGPSGTLTLVLGANVTAALPPGRAVYDVELVNSIDANDVIRIIQGKAKITPEATK